MFVDIKQKIGPQSEEETMQIMGNYCADPQHMSLEEVFTYLYVESRKYANDLVYNLLLATLIEDAD